MGSGEATLLFSVIALTVEDMFDEEEVMTFFELRDIRVKVQQLTAMVFVEILLDFEVFEDLGFLCFFLSALRE